MEPLFSNLQLNSSKVDSEIKLKKSPFAQLLDAVSAVCRQEGIWSEAMHRDLPKRWEKHGDMILLPQNCFTLPEWRSFGGKIWSVVAESLGAKRIGRKRKIAADEYRTPHVDLLYGKDGWVEHIDNGIRYQYDVTKCMFSIGNINEKIRVGNLDCKGQTVADMFAGIGYFTLPYLVHAGATHVYAVDWNPDAVEALERNLSINRVTDRCTVLEGDCRKMTPVGVCDRANLGLLPTARQYWLIGCRALKPTGGVLHIHDTLTAHKMIQKKTELNRKNSAPPPVPKKPSKPLPKQKSESELFPPENNPDNCTEFTNHSADSNSETNSNLEGNCGADSNSIQKRKLSRSESIMKELESRPRLYPLVEEGFDGWCVLDEAWRSWALDAARKCSGFMDNLHEDLSFQGTILRVGRVKSYAPHIDHVVLDLMLRPAIKHS